MSIIKPSKAKAEKLSNQLCQMKAYRERLDVYSRVKDTDFWKAFKKELDVVAEGNSARIHEALGGPIVGDVAAEYASLKMMEGARRIAEDLKGHVENTQIYMDKVDNEISKLKKMLEDETSALNELSPNEVK